MSVKIFNPICLFGLCVLWIVPNQILAQELGRDVLGHYAGNWKCRFTIEPQQPGQDPRHFEGEATGNWVLGDHFLEQVGRYRLDDNSPPLEIRTMMRFDQTSQQFYYDYFDSSGSVRRSTGKWDAAAKTMTSVFDKDENGNVTTIRADFSDTNTEQWTIESKNPAGETVLKMVGTNTRKQTGTR